jgi:hypothetical protein
MGTSLGASIGRANQHLEPTEARSFLI